MRCASECVQERERSAPKAAAALRGPCLCSNPPGKKSLCLAIVDQCYMNCDPIDKPSYSCRRLSHRFDA